MEEASKRLDSSSNTQTMAGEVDAPKKDSSIKDTNPNDVSDSGVCDVSGTDENPKDGSSATSDESLKAGGDNTGNSVSDEKKEIADVGSVEDIVEANVNVEETGAVETKDNVEKTVSSDVITEPETKKYGMECDRDAETVEVKPVDEIEGSDVQDVSKTDELVDIEMNDETAKNGATHEVAGENKILKSGGNEVTDEKANCEVEDNGGTCDAPKDFKPEKSHLSSVDGAMHSVTEDNAVQGKDSANINEEDNNKMDVDSEYANEENVGLHEQKNPEAETENIKHSESADVPQESTPLSKEEIVSEISSAAEIRQDVNQKEENREAMEIDYVAEEQVEKDDTDAGNESVGAIIIQTDVLIDEADKKDSNIGKELKVDEQKDSTGIASNLTVTVDSANSNSLTEVAAPGEVEPLDHNTLFDPGSDITNFIDFTGVSSWSGNTQDLKTDTGNVSLKEDKKTSDMAEEVPMADFSETLKSVDDTGNAKSSDRLSLSAEGIENESNKACGATERPRETSDGIMESEENQEDEDQKTADQQDAMGEEDETADAAPSMNLTQKQDTEMEENPNNSDYADDGTDSDIRTNGVKRKADVLSEDPPGEGRKTVSSAKVSFDERPSFKIGACIARAATQMAGSPSVLKGNNFGDETLSVESFVSQLHSAATDPVKENVVSEIAVGFFLDYRNSSASQQVTPEKVITKRGRPSNSNAGGGSEAFEFEEMGDTYWTDRVVHNGGEEQTPSTKKENYQVVPVELKPAQIQRTRRPYRKRQPQISVPLSSASKKPANFDENAPAELLMKFSEIDTIPPEKSLSKMFRHFGPIRESQTEVDRERNWARVVFRKGADAEVACNSAGRFNIFGTKAVNYEFSCTITETFKVHPYVVSLGEEEAALSLHS